LPLIGHDIWLIALVFFVYQVVFQVSSQLDVLQSPAASLAVSQVRDDPAMQIGVSLEASIEKVAQGLRLGALAGLVVLRQYTKYDKGTKQGEDQQ
jgi:hypothetical protein